MPQELDGPLSIQFDVGSAYGGYEGSPFVISYYLTDTALTQPAFGYITVPPGSAQIAVEKSVDLTNWVSSITKTVSGDSPAFFRLRVTK